MRLDPLGQHDHVQAVAEQNHRREQLLGRSVSGRRAHKTTVDLDDLRAQLHQVGERGVSGPKVIQRHRHVELSKTLDHADRRVDVEQCYALGDLQYQALGREPARRERLFDDRQQTRVMELPG